MELGTTENPSGLGRMASRNFLGKKRA